MIKVERVTPTRPKPVQGLQTMTQAPEFYYRWEWHLRASPETLWPLVADTNRFNRDTGVPSIQRRNAPEENLSNARRNLRLYRLGVPVEWEEEPFEWVRPYRYGVARHYSSGPVLEMRTLAELTPQPDGGTHVVYQVWATPRNLLGKIAIPVQIGFLSKRSFEVAFKRYDRFALNNLPLEMLPGQTHFAPGGKERLKSAREGLISEGAQPEIVTHLTEVIEKTDDIPLARMRPYQLADDWKLPRRDVLEHFLVATRRGMLELQWDVLCPLCRNAKQVTKTLGNLKEQVHCETCNIDFDVNFERSVELTFRPNPAIRETERGEFCIAGPQTTPHVAVQQLLAPGEERLVTPMLENGRYRLRTLKLRGGEYIQVSADGLEEISMRASKLDGWPPGEIQVAPHANIRLKNSTDEEQLFILERMTWSDQAVTASEVTALQMFRDLFANEALRPGEQISVGSLVIVFTDLRGSTRMYREIGDAPAFGLVMSHFDVLKDAINGEGGAIVKTIGDAVMAVFRRPAPAMRAMLHAQQALAKEDRIHPLQLRAGIHYGPCIAVTLNDRLDYFGSTVNMAARLEGFSTGGDVIVSEAVYTDPEVVELINSPDFGAERFHTKLKGFDDDHFHLWRVSLSMQPADQR